MIYGIAALVIAGLFIKNRKWDKAAVAIIFLAGGVIAAQMNFAAGLGGGIVKAVTIIGLIWLILDILTKKIEKATYGIAFFLPFFGIATSGKIGQLFDMVFNLNLLSKIFNAL